MNERYWSFTQAMLHAALAAYEQRISAEGGSSGIADFLSSPEARQAKLFADIHIHIAMPGPIGISGLAAGS